MKKGDWILSFVILGIAVLGFGLYSIIGLQKAGSAEVFIDGRQAGSYPLSRDCEIGLNGGTNILVIKDRTAKIVEADCPDQVCVRHKAISKKGESIICLPNKIVVSIDEGEGQELDSLTN